MEDEPEMDDDDDSDGLEENLRSMSVYRIEENGRGREDVVGDSEHNLASGGTGIDSKENEEELYEDKFKYQDDECNSDEDSGDKAMSPSILSVDIQGVPEIPLVVGDSAEGVEKTSAAIKVLKQIGAYPDAEKAKDSHAIRPGKGKMRNRRYISRKGPLIMYGTEGSKIVKAFRNIPGVEVANVERLNLLKLAPGGHLGRFIVWTKSAFEKLDSIYGSFEKKSEKKKGYVLPRSKMVNSDLSRIINSDEIQSVVRPIKKDFKRAQLKKNPLKNLNTLLKLNPYAKTARRMALLAEAQRVKAKKEKLDKKRKQVPKVKRTENENFACGSYIMQFGNIGLSEEHVFLIWEEAAAIKAAGKAWYQTMISDSDYTEFDNFSKWLGVSQ
ncbi:hypothetical protein HHK36_032664 [Tetracentron sinense]|uniref:Large ribosomal subunit protein uL4 C-terminal domain-containing protein n=1 Tax=Tetracentron sinense TaxID=13715 RepID=A0A834Y554_TETSI|nr:hypothetical protein HHK36_032664 [Tetracentron sinense]